MERSAGNAPRLVLTILAVEDFTVMQNDGVLESVLRDIVGEFLKFVFTEQWEQFAGWVQCWRFLSGHFDSLQLPAASFECRVGSTICR